MVAEVMVPSDSEPGLEYRVSRYPDGSWSCTCPGCRHAARADGLCKHVDREKVRRSVPALLSELLSRA
jgi:hypothetical protein